MKLLKNIKFNIYNNIGLVANVEYTNSIGKCNVDLKQKDESYLIKDGCSIIGLNMFLQSRCPSIKYSKSNSLKEEEIGQFEIVEFLKKSNGKLDQDDLYINIIDYEF